MSKKLFSFSYLLLLMALSIPIFGQNFTLNTTTSFLNNNGSGGVTFNIENTNSYDIIITSIEGVTGSSGTLTAQFWTKATPINGVPGAISAANGWTQRATGTFTAIANSSSVTTQEFLSGLSIIIPANTTVGAYVHAPGQRYFTMTTAQAFSAGGVNLLNGPNISYGGGDPPAAPTFTPRGWIGKVHFNPASPCTNPPTPGTAIVDNANVCINKEVELRVSGGSGGMNQTYQWESATTAAGPWTALSAPVGTHIYNHTVTASGYFRCKIVCSNNTPVYTNAVQVTVDTNLLSGTYTIDKNNPTAGTNFNSFADFLQRLDCGISGPVIVNVVSGTGPYTERIAIGEINGSSATNYVRINGNGNILQFNSTSTANMHMVTLDGTSHFTIDNLHIKSQNASFGWGVFLTGGAHHDTIRNCNIDLSSLTTSSSANANGIVINGSATTLGSAGNNAHNIYIANNVITGGAQTSAYGAYHGIYMYGDNATSYGTDTIHIINNEIKNFYYYGIYGYYNRVVNIEGNNIHKTGRTSATSQYGIYMYYSSAVKILDNKIHDFVAATTTSTSSVYPIYLVYPTNDNNAANTSLIANNAIYNLGNYGGTMYGIYLSSGYRTNVYHNTISQNFTSNGASTQYGIYISNSSGTFDVKNNIVDFSGGNQATKYGIYITSTSALVANGLQQNTVNMASTQNGTQYRTYYGTAYATLATLRAAYPALEVGTVDVDPVFPNITTGIIEPNNSILYRTGQNLTAIVPLDIDSTTRTATPTIGAKEMAAPPDRDLALNTLTNPFTYCGGLEPVKIAVSNYGSMGITSFVINWSVNSVAQTPYTWTGTLAPAATREITVGNFNFPANTSHNLRFTVSTVNNSTDQRSYNDTLNITGLNSSMHGTYTINQNAPASATNYQSFTTLATDLQAKGVCAPVVVNVVAGSGPYVERFLLNDIRGTSSTNTIKINGNENTIQFNSTAQSTMHMVVFNGTKHVKIDNLKIKTLNASYGYGILFTNGAANDSITNCHIDLSTITTTSSTNSSAIAFSSSMTSPTGAGNNARNIYIGNNLIDAGHPTTNGGAYYGISIYGTGSADYGTDSIFIVNNELRNFYYYGIYAYYSGDLHIKGNDIHKSTKTATTTNYGITYYYSNGEISGNKIHDLSPLVPTNTSIQYGMQLGYMNSSTTYGKKLFKVTNNAIYNIGNSGELYGIYSYGGDSSYIAHNTVNINLGTGTSTSAQYGIYVYNTSNSYQVRNNNVTFTAGNNGTKYGIYCSNTLFSTNAAMQNNNVFMNSSRTGTQNRAYYGAARANLAALQAAYPALEMNGLEVNPMYANQATGDLTPTNGAIFMKGENLTTILPTDINSIVRPIPPTAGAFDLQANLLNNAGIAQIVSPRDSFCSGDQDVSVEVVNAGYNNIDSLIVNWSVDNVLQTPITIATTIAGTMASTNNATNVLLGNVYFPYATPVTIKAWTSMPNGVIDITNNNDTLLTVLQAAYTVVVDLGADTALCDNQTLILAGGLPNEPQFTYSWDNLSTNTTRSVNTAGTYWVTKRNLTTGCIATDTITVTYNMPPVVDLGADTATCIGNVITLDAGNVGATYLWNDSTTNKTLNATTTGVYTVTVTNQYGCISRDSIDVNFNNGPHATGINVVPMTNGEYMFSVQSGTQIDQYRWSFGDGDSAYVGTIPHQFNANGSYTVSVKLSNECGDTTLYTTINVQGLSIGNVLKDATVKLYPNPTKNMLTINMSNKAAIQNVIIYNILGQQVAKYHINTNSNEASINVEDLPSGIYNMQVVTDKGVMQAKFEILK